MRLALPKGIVLAALLGSSLAGVAILGQPAPPLALTDITNTAGITFAHHNGATGKYRYPELFGGGNANHGSSSRRASSSGSTCPCAAKAPPAS